jgi:oligosaccharide repeat unit polymerase
LKNQRNGGVYGIEDKLMAIVFSLALLLQACAVRYVVGTFLVPGALFSLVWFVFTILPLTFIFDAPVNSRAILYIFLCGSAFASSAFCFDWRRLRTSSCNRKIYVSQRWNSVFLKNCLYFSVVMAIVLSTVVMVLDGWALADIVSDPLGTSGRFAAKRGTEGIEYGFVGVMSVFFTYIAPALGGLVSSSQQSKLAQNMFFLVSIMPGVFTMLVQSSKLVFLVSLSFFVASLFVVKICNLKLNLFDRQFLYRICAGVLCFSPVVLVSFVTREGYSSFGWGDGENSLLMFTIVSYLFGQLYAFSDFFSFAVGMPSVSTYVSNFYSYGAYTFASVFEVLGLPNMSREGVYIETVHFLNVFETNIFTAFRGLIYDYGVAGSVVFFLYFGVVAHLVFYHLIRNPNSRAAVIFYISIVVFIFTTYLSSVFISRFMFLVGLGLYVVLALNDLQKIRRLRVS